MPSRRAFLTRGSFGVLIFERPPAPQPAVHISASRVHGVLSQDNYFALIGVIKGGTSAPCFHTTANLDTIF